MSRYSEGVAMIRGMALAAASAVANGEGVRTEVKDDFDRETLKVRLFIGQKSEVFPVSNFDVDHVQTDAEAQRRVERSIQDAIAKMLH